MTEKEKDRFYRQGIEKGEGPAIVLFKYLERYFSGALYIRSPFSGTTLAATLFSKVAEWSAVYEREALCTVLHTVCGHDMHDMMEPKAKITFQEFEQTVITKVEQRLSSGHIFP